MIRVTADVRQELAAIDAALPQETMDEEAYQARFAAALDQRRTPAWMHELLLEADLVEAGLGTRFIRLPDGDSRAGYADMEAFIATVASPLLQERLWAAIRGRGAFRRFKDVLASSPTERERWFNFKDVRARQRVRAWLADEGIELIEEEKRKTG